MKKILSILVVSVILFGCSTEVKRYHIDELTYNVNFKVMDVENGLFNGIGYDVYDNGQLKYEGYFTDGKNDGLGRGWYENGQLQWEGNYKDGNLDGIHKIWYENGQLEDETKWKNGELVEITNWDENGQLKYESNF